MLREAGAGIWGQNRPLILAWIVYEAPKSTPEMISNDSVNAITNLLKQNAEERGLPLMLPVMDMTDLNQISTKDVAEFAIPKLIDASKRYTSDAMLIGHITQNTNEFVSQWKLIFGNNQWNWNFSDKNIANIIPLLINNLTHEMAARFAIVTTNNIQQNLTMKVTGITHYSDFAQLTRYLNHLTPVANVEIIKTEADNSVILKVSLRSTQESFTQALSLGKKLISLPATNTNDTMVAYQWNP
jgi:hypothetical protein